MNQKIKADIAPPRIISWEITRRCNLSCPHCRASAVDSTYEDELTTEEGYRLIDSILDVGRPMLILTGGEPLMRGDIFDLAGYAVSKGLTVSSVCLNTDMGTGRMTTSSPHTACREAGSAPVFLISDAFPPLS